MTIIEQMAAGQAPPILPLSVEQYHGMIANGILREGETVELIDGVLVRKDRADRGGDPMSHGPRHALGVKRLLRSFRALEGSGCHWQSQLPVTLGSIQEPEPDLAIVRGREEDFESRHPGPADLAVVVEVTDSSLTFDRTTKQHLYASAVIPVYWIVNLVEKQIEVYEAPDPAKGQYARRTDYRAGESVRLELAPGLMLEVAVNDVLLP